MSRPRGELEPLDHLGDFTTDARVLPSNIFFFQRFDTALVSPAGHHLGPFVVFVPILGALVVGVLARYESERGYPMPNRGLRGGFQ